MDRSRLLTELLEASAAPNIELLSRAKALLGAHLGCDDVYIVPFDERFAAHAPPYLREFALQRELVDPLFLAARRALARGAYIDTELFSAPLRDRMRLYADHLRPMGLRSQAVHLLRHGGRSVGVIHCNRYGRHASPFSSETLADLAPAAQLMALATVAHAAEPTGEIAALLTRREREVAELAVRGYELAQIAAHTGRSPLTVRNQLHSAYRKLGVCSRVDLANQWFGRATRETPVWHDVRQQARRLDRAS